MGLIKKLFKTDNVYAGPEPVPNDKKDDYKMREVYAGPEQMSSPQRRDFEMLCVYAGPEQMGGTGIPPAQDVDDKMMQMIYAAPDLTPVKFDLNQPLISAPYPFNNASSPGVFATPESDSDGVPESTETAFETVTCSVCGKKVRSGKFCENCGFVLK